MIRHSTGLVRSQLLLSLALLVCGCDTITDEPEQDPDAVSSGDVVSIRVLDDETVPADGSSTTTLAATIPLDASPRVVTFSTTAGVFALSGGKTIPVRASLDSDGDALEATAVLRADTTAGVAEVSAVIEGFRASTRITFAPVTE